MLNVIKFQQQYPNKWKKYKMTVNCQNERESR